MLDQLPMLRALSELPGQAQGVNALWMLGDGMLDDWSRCFWWIPAVLSFGLFSEVSLGTVVLWMECGYCKTEHFSKRLEVKQLICTSMQIQAPCSNFPDLRKADGHWTAAVSQSKSAYGDSPPSPEVSSHWRQTQSCNTAWFLLCLVLPLQMLTTCPPSAPAPRGSSAKGGDERPWLCSPRQVKALGGTYFFHHLIRRQISLLVIETTAFRNLLDQRSSQQAPCVLLRYACFHKLLRESLN